MAKRRTKAEIREEFIRLLDVFCFLCDQQIEGAREDGDHQWLEILESDPKDKETMLADFDAGRRWSHPDDPHQPEEPKWTASMHLQGLREALNDMLIGVREAIEEEPATGPNRWSKIPETYFAATGRDIFVDGGDPMGRIKAVLKRGSIVTEEEWRMFNEVVSNVDTKLLSAKQVDRAERLMASFEAGVKNA